MDLILFYVLVHCSCLVSNSKTMAIIREYNDYVKKGSRIDVLVHHAQIESEFAKRQRKKAQEQIVEEKAGFSNLGLNLGGADLMAVAQNRGEICLSIKLNQYEGNLEENYGVKLIPKKNTVYELSAQDHLVVLAEDEF